MRKGGQKTNEKKGGLLNYRKVMITGGAGSRELRE